MNNDRRAMLLQWATTGLVVIIGGTQSTTLAAQEALVIAAPLSHAHAHNDYEHTRPLAEALEQGFCSVEADIHCVDGQLLVAHDANDVRPDRTLERLYLDPLRARLQTNHGHIHTAKAPFELFIDIKTEAETTYAVLDKTLARYDDLFVRYEEGQRHDGPIEVVISGNRPTETVAHQSRRYVAIDGRLSNLAGDQGTHAASVMPWISDRWTAHFRWNGKGTIDAAELEKLQDFVATTHRQGRRLRFWATPETPEMWRVLHTNHVDLINTDDLAGLAAFLRDQR